MEAQSENTKLDTKGQDFKDYALTTAQKFRSDKLSLLQSNRQKMYSKAFSVLDPQLRKAARILDFGCGTGEFLSFVRTRCSAKIVGFDPSSSQLGIAKQRLENEQNVVLLSDPNAIDGKFDLIFSHHVIEHVPDDQLHGFLMRLSGLLSEQGRLILTTPNGLNPSAYAFFMSTDRTHVRLHSPFSLAEALQPVGLEIESIHRELPQAYDFITSIRFLFWKFFSFFSWLQILTVAGGVRGLKFPLVMWSSFFVVAAKKPASDFTDNKTTK